MKYFVTAIHTDSGKTLISSILCEALGADYWKPVQSGLPRDTDTARALISRTDIVMHPEAYVLKTPASPHAAARIDGVTIDLNAFQLPDTTRPLIIEGAGGCLVPLNDRDFVIDIALHLQTPVILVSNLYLGSINHTLLTWEALQRRNVSIKGIIFNGPSNAESERIILHHTQLPCLLRVAQEPAITREVVQRYAQVLKTTLNA